MITPLDAEQFFEALNSERGLMLGVSAEGFIRKTADPKVIEFSPSLPAPLCVTWIKVPITMIDRVQPLGKRQCLDHVHDYVVLYFKQPASEDAAVFSELLQHAMNALATPAAVGGESMTGRANCLCGTVYSFVSGNPIGNFRVCEPDLAKKLYAEKQKWGIPPNRVQLSGC